MVTKSITAKAIYVFAVPAPSNQYEHANVKMQAKVLLMIETPTIP